MVGNPVLALFYGGYIDMREIKIAPIGSIAEENGEFRIVLDPKYRDGLRGLDGFSHVAVLWWMDGSDSPEERGILVEKKPYTHGPEEIGVFATRSPRRPNPIAISHVHVQYVDAESGTIGIDWIDAFPGSAVLDLKPYTPSVDRVLSAQTPSWCSHWPQSYEDSADFDWESEFNF